MNEKRGHERIAALVVISRVLTIAQITELAGIAPDRYRALGSLRPEVPRSTPAKENSWELCERAEQSTALSELIERLSTRIVPLRLQLAALKEHGCGIKLELVQWISATDDAGPGFSLDIDLIGLLSYLGASVDVDQYVDS